VVLLSSEILVGFSNGLRTYIWTVANLRKIPYNKIMNKNLTPKFGIQNEVNIPGDKSITHRAIILGAIADGITKITGALVSDDCLATINCFRQMGVEITQNGDCLRISGVGLRGLKKPAKPLYVGNSGTTMRLLAGLLAAQSFDAVLDGDESIRRRPMGRVAQPLAAMGAAVSTKEGLAPIAVSPCPHLTGMDYKMPMPSAQVKSAILLAGLYANGATRVIEQHAGLTRNHTELMMAQFGANVTTDKNIITIHPARRLAAQNLIIPADISSAAFFLPLVMLLGKKLTIKNVGINPTRTGILDAFAAMGGCFEITNRRISCGEPVGNITISHSKLKGIDVDAALAARMIDEIPIFAAAACFAEGTTTIRGAGELRFKETDRLAALTAELGKLGADITPTDDGFVIQGSKLGQPKQTPVLRGYGDHRIVMALAIAATLAGIPFEIDDASCVKTSFPDFFETLDCISPL